MSSRFIKTDALVYLLLFVLLASFLIHNFDSIGQDIGRHLKVGEIIWQTKEVPKTNLFSFTEPNFSFINHHWLSEIIFYGVFNLGGFTGLILLKIFLVLVTFLLLFFLAKKHATFWPLAISFLLSLFIFISRTEVRPEIFSYAILAFFLFVLFREKYKGSTLDLQKGRTLNLLWFLPLAQLLWVNLHIYFFIGPFLVLAFLVDQLANQNHKQRNMPTLQFVGDESDAKSRHIPKLVVLKRILIIMSLVFLATLINPHGLQGALLPFNILKEYGYSIVENQTLSFLADFFSFNLPIFVFKVSVGVLVVSFLLMIKKTKERIFEILISAFFVYAGFKMFRNLPLYALASFPVIAILLTDLFNQGSTLRPVPRSNLKNLSRVLKILFSVFLIIMIGSVVNNSFYRQTHSGKVFGFSVPNGLERAGDFVKENKIEGPMFNNFDIGGYLIWKLPEHKVFVDNRPEAYSVEFFSEVYKPMQEDQKKWAELSHKYGINFIFFGHTDATPWGQTFLKNIVRNSDWKVVFINENAIILVKNVEKNKPIFSKYKYELAE